MRLKFDLTDVDTTEFGVGKEDGQGQEFIAMTVDADVQTALREMAASTWDAMQANAKAPEKYDPSEKHASIEHLFLPLGDGMARAMRNLHEAANLPVNAAALKNPASVFCYFARMIDKSGEHLTALRRATQFKGSLKSRFIRIDTNALKLVHDRVFRLDQDFDLLIDSANIHILRPSSFEFAGQLQGAIMAAVPDNIAIVQRELAFVEFSGIEAYARKHPRAARYLASIRSQEQCKNVEKRALKALCKRTGVKFSEVQGKLVIADDDVMGFLEVVDRRRYEVTLVKGSPERFKAASRQPIAS
jgi:Domain of unknown function (DUF4868)